ALVVADESVMRTPRELGNEKRRDTPHSKRFAAIRLRLGRCAVSPRYTRCATLRYDSRRQEASLENRSSFSDSNAMPVSIRYAIPDEYNVKPRSSSWLGVLPGPTRSLCPCVKRR